MSYTNVSRRRFLSSLAIAGITPVFSKSDAFAWLQPVKRFTGEDVEEAHRLLQNPQAILAGARIELQPGVLDVAIVGGGIAGLTTAWWLKDRNVVVFEREREAGGVSRSETWNGIEYALGAAYIIDPASDSEDAREKRGFELLRDLGLRDAGEDIRKSSALQRRLSGDINHVIFTRRRILAERDVYSPRNIGFFREVLDSDHYPSVPAEDQELVQQLDTLSFADFLGRTSLQRKIYGRSFGAVSAFAREALEYYFWGAFGTTAEETSAYHGLNFLAAEYGDILVFPGGNAAITKALATKLQAARPDSVRTGATVLRVERAPDSANWHVLVHRNGAIARHEARNVVFASPLFLAPAIIPSLPDDQRRAIGTLDYRSYVVANVLLARPANKLFTRRAFHDGYELTPVHGRAIQRNNGEAASRRNVFSDAILADFAAGRHASKSVLTVYRPHPYAAGRAEVLSRTYAEQEEEVRKAVLEQFGAHGLRESDIEEIRLSRWGHPMIVARPGQLADGTMKRARQGLEGVFFAHTDTQGAPAYENALASAMDAADAIRRR